MPGEIYGSFEFAQKSYTRGSDIGKSQIGLPHLNPPLFLELKLIKSHTHTGVDSVKLKSAATPEMIRGFKTEEREERGIATWTGGAAASGSVVLTFGTAFLEAPTVIAISGEGDADLQVAVGSITASQCTLFWKDDTAATWTSVRIQYLIKGK